MPFFTWVPNYTVGITVVDMQHMQLVDLTNTLYSLKDTKLSPLECLKLIKNAISYVENHFQTEEDIMEARKFELVESHKKEHKDFLGNIIKVVQEFESSGNIDLKSLSKYLKDWIRKHIATVDKQHFKIMMKHGLTNDIADDFNRPLDNLVLEIR
jgi:hemerythrin-like metal-binding protein